MKNEVWKNIKNYPDYLISNYGRVKSFKYKKERILKIKKSNGYNMVSLCNSGIISQVSIHRLIALEFVPRKNKKPYVNHINGIRDDNRIENLEWCTQKENINSYFTNNHNEEKCSICQKYMAHLSNRKLYKRNN